jgi:hypothetical protein
VLNSLIVEENNLNKKFKTSLIHGAAITLTYLSMFALMTYNVYVIFSILIGHGVGYYQFGLSKKIKIRKLDSYTCCG